MSTKTLQISVYNRELTGFNYTGEDDPTTTIFIMETSALGAFILCNYARHKKAFRYIAHAYDGTIYHDGAKSVANIRDKVNPDIIKLELLHKLNEHARPITLRKLLTIVKPSPILVTH